MHRTIAFEEGAPHIMIPVRIGGARGSAIVDNGAYASIVDRTFAGGKALNRIGLGPDFETRLDPILGDLSAASDLSGRPIAALLGAPLFHDFPISLDFGARTMTFHDRRAFEPSPDLAPLHCWPDAARKHRVEVELPGGPPVRALFDLGCSAPLLLSRQIAEERSLFAGRPVSTRRAAYMGGAGVSTVSSLAEARFAGQVFRDIPVETPPSEALALQSYDVILGLPLLRKFDLCLDLRRSRIWARAGARLNEAFSRPVTGLQTEGPPGQLRITHVASHSPGAASGLAQGQQITLLDGLSATRASLNAVVSGQRIEIVLSDASRHLLKAQPYY